jgi:Ca2+-transporting ATPase
MTRSVEYWAHGVETVLGDLGTDPTTGLSSLEAADRLLRCGPNQLPEALPRSLLSMILDQLRSVVTALLIAAAVIAFAFSEPVEGIAILAVILLNSGIGFTTEWRATRSMESLKDLGRVETKVLREGIVQLVVAEKLVPGDIVLFESGDTVSADVRLLEAAGLQSNESMLTGESMPIAKQTGLMGTEVRIAERSNCIFKGTGITRGSARGVVVDTGLNTELGRISMLATQAESEQTPLEKRLDMLGKRLAIAVIIIGALIAAAGVVSGRDTFLAIEVAIALAVAAIPEGLPIVATIALARGMMRMAQRNALISKLSAVETLGATSIILTDKTGTLTENQMTVTAMYVAGVETLVEGKALQSSGLDFKNGADIHPDSARLIREMLEVAALCNNASIRSTPDGKTHTVGDPTELALLRAAMDYDLQKNELERRLPRQSEVAFDPERKIMATYHLRNSKPFMAIKGAPEVVLSLCNATRLALGESQLNAEKRAEWLSYTNELGNRGLRTLAIAYKAQSDSSDDGIENLILLGIVGIEDPAREGVKDAIAQCHDAGISIVMVTGDHLATAQRIAFDVGIATESSNAATFVDGPQLDDLLSEKDTHAVENAAVISRAMPEQKLALIRHYQQRGEVVAMTGDGVNDAPALKKADIGIAMGIRGTAVAKEASHMVLLDDEFSTIVVAVAQGRTIYENIRKFVVYLLSCNISEVLVVTLATIVGAPLPLLPLQILFLNLVTDIFPALALGVGEGSPSRMLERPRPSNQPLLTRIHWIRIMLFGSIISASVLGAMSISLIYFQFSIERAVSVSFCTLALAQLVHVFNMRDDAQRIYANDITANIWIWAAVALCLALILLAIYTPILSTVLGLTDPGWQGWLIIIPMSILPLILSPLLIRIVR